MEKASIYVSAFRRQTSTRWPQRVLGGLGGALLSRPFSGQSFRLLVVYEREVVAQSQVNPIFYYLGDIEQQLGIEVRAISSTQFLEGRDYSCSNADAVILQTSFRLSKTHCAQVEQAMSLTHPNAKLIYFDWFAPLDLRALSFFSDVVDVYVKKQVFADLAEYEKSFAGDTNLTDYYSEKYDLGLPRVLWRLPSNFHEKLVLGPGFFTDLHMLPKFDRPLPSHRKVIDIHARFETKGDSWYGLMRREAASALASVSHKKLSDNGRIQRKHFIGELESSRICLSPFGFGEVCWRDYEAILAGSLLFKPDMSHIKTEPDIFVPYQTYIPLAWDYRDLKEKAEYYLQNVGERERIVGNAYEIVNNYVVNKEFIPFLGALTKT